MSPSTDPIQHAERGRRSRRLFGAVAALFLIGGVTAVGNLASPGTAAAATVAVNQCNGDETGAAREIRCDVTIINTLDVATGATSSSVTTVVCAGAPGEAACVTTPGSLTTDIVGSVAQCNDSANAGGSTVTCNVTVVNNITGAGSATPATVNQCIGSAEGGTTTCAPATSVSGADVTQCNGSGNGGGGLVTCTVPTSTVSDLWSVTINQCNGSANGGGDLVTCTAQITTNLLAPQAASTTIAASTVTTTPGGTTGTTVGASSAAVTPTGGGVSATGSNAAAPSNAAAGTPGALPPTGGTTTGILIASLLTTVGMGVLFLSRRHAA